MRAGERRAIQLAALTEDVSTSELSRQTIRRLLAGDDFAAMRAGVQNDLIAEAKDILAGGVALAAHGWNTAVGVAAARGNHAPARDLLVSQHVIESGTAAPAPAMKIQINVGAIGFGVPRRAGPTIIDVPMENESTS